MIDSRKKGFVLVCNKNGELDSVIKDDYNIFSDKKTNFYDFFEQDSQFEVRNFLDRIYDHDAPFGNVIKIKVFQNPHNFCLAGAPYDSNAIIIGSSKENFDYYCNEMKQSLSKDLKFLDKLCSLNSTSREEAAPQSDEVSTPSGSAELQSLQQKLAQSEKALKNKTMELDQFAHIVSHDLKAPLSQSKLIVHLLEKRLRSETANREILELFDMLIISTNHMSDLIDSIQRYSKSGYLDQKLTSFQADSLFDEVVDDLPVPPNMVVTYGRDLPVIYANRQKLYQVLFQLVSNAIRFHHKANGNIEIKFEELEEFYSFEIIDDGPGIPEDYHQSIFEIFNRINLRSHKSGSGVGLSIARKLVEEGGGILSLDSKVGTGSNFRFIWPKWNGLVPGTL